MAHPVIHDSWLSLKKRTSACDFCSTKNIALQQCQLCMLNVCKKCLQAGKLENNPRHRVSRDSAGDFVWHQTLKELASALHKPRIKNQNEASIQKSCPSRAHQPEPTAPLAQSLVVFQSRPGFQVSPQPKQSYDGPPVGHSRYNPDFSHPMMSPSYGWQQHVQRQYSQQQYGNQQYDHQSYVPQPRVPPPHGQYQEYKPHDQERGPPSRGQVAGYTVQPRGPPSYGQARSYMPHGQQPSRLQPPPSGYRPNLSPHSGYCRGGYGAGYEAGAQGSYFQPSHQVPHLSQYGSRGPHSPLNQPGLSDNPEPVVHEQIPQDHSQTQYEEAPRSSADIRETLETPLNTAVDSREPVVRDQASQDHAHTQSEEAQRLSEEMLEAIKTPFTAANIRTSMKAPITTAFDNRRPVVRDRASKKHAKNLSGEAHRLPENTRETVEGALTTAVDEQSSQSLGNQSAAATQTQDRPRTSAPNKANASAAAHGKKRPRQNTPKTPAWDTGRGRDPSPIPRSAENSSADVVRASLGNCHRRRRLQAIAGSMEDNNSRDMGSEVASGQPAPKKARRDKRSPTGANAHQKAAEHTQKRKFAQSVTKKEDRETLKDVIERAVQRIEVAAPPTQSRVADAMAVIDSEDDPEV